jgi:predicted outer membrane repeat protein
MNSGISSHTTTLAIRLSVLLALIISLLAVRKPARSSSLEVTNTYNSGTGSLRQAITDANISPGADTITFNAALNGTPIVLSGAAGENANASGDLDILNSGDLNIVGNGASNTIIDGGSIDRVFHVCPAGGCTNTVSLTGMTIRNGDALGTSGGAIYTTVTLTITNSTIGGPAVGNTAAYGAGIYNAAGRTTLDGCNLNHNTADISGGGIYNNPLTELIVLNNSTIGGGNTADYGGGIHNAAGSVTINDSTVWGNSADYGGGIYNWEEGMLTITNSTIGGSGAGNSAVEDGGGIFNEFTGVTIVITSTVSDNDAHRGGGIYAAGTLTITNSTIGEAGSGNTASLFGGGIYIEKEATTVDDSTINANQAFNGGGIYNYGTLNIRNGSTIGEADAGNTATNEGGGIYNQAGATTTVADSTVSSNTANYGGGILTQGTLNIQDGSTIGGVGAGNTANNSGGGIYNLAGVMTVTGSRILHNTATNEGGGVFSNINSAWVTIVTGSCIVGNSAYSFFNNQDAQQNVNNNWWGSPTGANTPGADTFSGHVYYASFQMKPILGCGFCILMPLILK